LSIGILVRPDEVEVSTSRENVLWKKKTREGIQKKLDLVKDTAAKFVQEKLNISEDNLFVWLSSAHDIMLASKRVSSTSNKSVDDVLYQLSKVVNLKEISFEKVGDSTGNFVYSPITEYFKSKDNVLISRYITQGKISYNGYRDSTGTTNRTGITSWGDLFNANVIFLVKEDEQVKKEVIRYLLQKYSKVAFIHERGYEFNKKLKPFVEAGIENESIKMFSDEEIDEEALKGLTQIEAAAQLSPAELRALSGKVSLKVIKSGNNWAQRVEMLRSDISELEGLYCRHDDLTDVETLRRLFGDDNIYILSEELEKIVNKTNNLKYYKDAIFEVREHTLYGLSSKFYDWVKTLAKDTEKTVSSYKSTAKLNAEEIMECKSKGYKHALALDVIANKQKPALTYHTVYMNTSYVDSDFVKKLFNSIRRMLIKFSKGKGYRFELGGVDYGIITSIDGLQEYMKDIQEYNKLQDIIDDNDKILSLYHHNIITLEEYNKKIKININN